MRRKWIQFFVSVLFLFNSVAFAQGGTSCQDGEVGVVVSLSFTQVIPVGEVTWDIQDQDGNIYATNPFTYAANFVYTSTEVCLQEGQTYTFNAYDAGGDGWGNGSWYEVGMCGGYTTLIDNDGNAPNGNGVSEDFTLPVVDDECFCFRVDYEVISASSEVATDGGAITSTYAGNPPFTYQWSNGDTTPNLTGVAPGLYILTVTDSLGCETTQQIEVQGPSIFMSPTDVEVCTGYFYDSGGANGNFDSGENYIMTICSTDPELSSALEFYDFNLGGTFWDSPTFTIYDGSSTAAPVLYSYDGPGDPAPEVIQATPDNETGCLTIHFSSPNGFTNSGWFAEINCQYPCQDYNVEVISSDGINADNEINVCYELELEVETDYFENNTFYTQSDITTTFEWTFNDGLIQQSGQQVSQVYDEESVSEITLLVTDVNECFQSFTFTAIKDHPSIITAIIPPEEDEVCPETTLEAFSGVYAGTDSSIASFFDPITWYITEEVLPPIEIEFGDPVYLPDGLDSYVTSVNITAYDPLVTLDANDFTEVCAQMEHSYLGDLDMSLTAPNGATVQLFNQSGGGTWLGNAIDNNSDEIAGDCWEYCWSITPQFDTFTNSGGNTMAAPNGGQSMIPGSYTPAESFAAFAGSGANGTWTLTVTDNLLIDNGFICGWSISMDVQNDSIPIEDPIVDSITPTILNYSWYCQEEPSSIIMYDSTQVIVEPTNAGIHTYVMTILDDFGCEYTEEFIVDVYDTPILAPDGVADCQDNYILGVTDVPPGGGEWTVVDSPDGSTVVFDPDINSFNPTVTVSQTGEYTFEFIDHDCKYEDEITVDFEIVNPIIETPEDVICALDNIVSVDNPTVNPGLWTLIGPDSIIDLPDPTLEDAFVIVPDFGTYQLAYTIDFCHGTDTVDLNFISVDPLILNPGVQICAFDVDLEVDNPSPTVGSWNLIDQPNHTSASFELLDLEGERLNLEVDHFGEYMMEYTIHGCETSDSMTVVFGQVPPKVFAEELILCGLETEMHVETSGLDVGWMQIDGPSFANFSDPLSQETSLSVSQYGDYTLAYTACDSTVEFNVLFMCNLTIPNVISSNGDEQNDYLYIDGLTEEFYSYSNLSVYNRWGDEVYRNGHYGLDGKWWDGQSSHENDILAEGVYFYVLKVGNKVTEEQDVYKGSFHIFR